MADKEINFQEELNRLEKIVNDIQQKEVPLEESMKMFEEGQKIIKTLSEELKKAEAKVEKIIESNK